MIETHEYPQLPSGVDLVKVGLTVTVAVLSVALLLVWWMGRDDLWRPLGPFPQQTVQHPDGEVGDPIFDVSEGHIQVVGTKCRGDQPVQVVGTLAWRRVSPAGFSTEPIRFPPSVQPADCITTTFQNEIPRMVVVDVCRDGSSVWQIGGDETPVGEVVDGEVRARPGASLGWETEPFTLTCEGDT